MFNSRDFSRLSMCFVLFRSLSSPSHLSTSALFQMTPKQLHSKAHDLPPACFSQGISPGMDPGIWSRLPRELLEHILCFLPWKKLLGFRSTCKYFQTLIFSPFFVSKCSSPPFSSFLLLSQSQCYDHLLVYDSVLGKWCSLSLSLSSSLPLLSSSNTLLSSSNGLFCFSFPNSSSFLVCNLLTKSSRLVSFPVFPFAFELLTLISTPIGFKIFTLCSGSSSSSVFLYDSGGRSWHQYSGAGPVLSENNHQEGAYLNGCLHFATTVPFSIFWFDLGNGKWQRSQSELPGELTFVRPVSDGEEKLYLIGGIGSDGISRRLKLWEFGEEREWVDVDVLPELMCRKFTSVCYHNYEHVYCFYHQGMICVCCKMWPEILYYRISRRTWHWVPRCPSLPEKGSCGFRWFSFVPELYAAA